MVVDQAVGSILIRLFANAVPLVYDACGGLSLGYFILFGLTSVNLRLTQALDDLTRANYFRHGKR